MKKYGATLRFFLTLLVGLAGSLLFKFAGLPLPWLLGALSASALASLAGAPVGVTKPIRLYIMVILGVMLGGAFSPDVLAHIGEWVPTLIAAVVYLGLITFVAQTYCRKVLGMDRITAIFSGFPGGLSEMTLLGEEAGADVQALTLTHACRVATILLAIPLFLTYWAGLETVAPLQSGPFWNLQDIVFLIITAIVGLGLGKILGFPAHHLTGPLLISAIVHTAGLIDHEPFDLVKIILQLTLGSALGARFAGYSFRQIGRIMLLAVGMAFVMMAVTLLVSALLSQITDASFEALILALSPGGFAEMTLAALSMGIDPAFVTTHHALRLLVIVFIVPIFLARLLKKQTSPEKPEGEH
ncbi:AbrB family transcriptional regulator [Kiloniella laminariae]|uniref:AbrB family transcriptional regulator n=1 Tax=Kiloniella laminariae TaxID=454162 RepID=UPI00035DD5F3|nr:AbrB family transcriptional regulator [Kiloniella laminariae]